MSKKIPPEIRFLMVLFIVATIPVFLSKILPFEILSGIMFSPLYIAFLIVLLNAMLILVFKKNLEDVKIEEKKALENLGFDPQTQERFKIRKWLLIFLILLLIGATIIFLFGIFSIW